MLKEKIQKGMYHNMAFSMYRVKESSDGK